MKFREKEILGTKIFLGKDAKSNDELMNKFKRKENVILHTIAPGSPFCVIEKLNPSRKIIDLSGAFCASYSQAWRDNKSDILVHQFTGKEIKKPLFAKDGTWKITKTPKVIKIKKTEIEKVKK